jgi:DNA-binding response OmpR family regulator
MVNLLLIDDDTAYAQVVMRLLESHGYHVDYAPSALLGLRQAREFRPDIILIDMHLPDLDGKVVALQLCKYQVGKRIPLVAFTVDSGPKAKRIALSFGCDDLISKPIDPNLFPQQLDEIMSRMAPSS